MSGFLSTLTAFTSLLIPGPRPNLPREQGRREWRGVRSEWLSLNAHSSFLAPRGRAMYTPLGGLARSWRCPMLGWVRCSHRPDAHSVIAGALPNGSQA